MKEAFAGYAKPSIAVDAVLLRTAYTDKEKRVQVLLVKKPFEYDWHLPGTIVRLGERGKDALGRVINFESSTASSMVLNQFYTMMDDIERDERGHIVSVAYVGMCKNIDEAENSIVKSYEAKWLYIDGSEFTSGDDKVSLKSLKYDHANIVEKAVEYVRTGLFDREYGFNFVDSEFTLRDLECTFVAINGKDIPGFRRLMKDKVVGTGVKIVGDAHRPAEIFKKSIEER